MEETMSRTILVIGATGTQGRAVIRHLRKAGFDVRGLVRNPDSKTARPLAGEGIALVRGDLEDVASLEAAMTGVDGVYLVTDFFKNGIEGEIRHGKRVADLCAKLGIRHLVHASVSGADRKTGVPHFDSKGEIERHIQQLEVPATFLRPAIFFEDLVEKKYFPPASWGMMPKIVGADRPIKWVSVEDIAAAATTVFSRRDEFLGKAIPLVGDEKSMTEARAIFTRIRGKKPFKVAMPTFLFRKLVSEELVLMFEWLAKDSMDGDVATTRSVVDRPLDMETWLRARNN
jgi:uncharacterized protein YbjT (DUF2867 family)